jgi:glycosyltransferase involved in cell wall biosynthesis
MISVILPVYNAERWIGDALRSLSSQGTAAMEIIAIDDGSTDASIRVLKRSSDRSLSVRLLRNESNLGIVATLNRGLDQAQGDYVARMDADDICMPDRFARQIAFLEQTGCDICGSWFIEFGQGIPRTVRWPHSESALRAAMLFQNTLCHPTIMAKREVFEQLRYREDYRLAEDYDLFGRACTKFRVANVPAPLLRYRRHSQQATQAKIDAMQDITCQIRLEMLSRQKFNATSEEQRLHNMIRAPSSIRNENDLRCIEEWLLKLYAAHDKEDARSVVASQWVRACIRAAPLGQTMWHIFQASPLREAAKMSASTMLDLRVLSVLKLDYHSRPFNILRRFGLSA